MTTAPRPGSLSFEDRVTKARPFEWGYGSTPRTAKLRDQLYWKASVVKDWINVSLGLGKMAFRQGIWADVDRARIVTQSFRETEGQPIVLRYAQMVERLCDEGTIPHVQFNVVSSELLREAQVNPETHSDLIVRVAGYSAHFIDPPQLTQDSLIARTEQVLG